MLTQEKNDRLCRVGAGTAGNQLFKSIWLPAALSTQLQGAQAAPVRLKLLGEELLGFRDENGVAGIVQSKCIHRGAPLFFGRVEAQGLRCAYHGWLYDTQGQCLEIPSEPHSGLCKKMKLKAYPVVEKAGIVWIYMGQEPAPALPKFPWIDLPDEQRHVSVWLHAANWFQGAEGEIDSSHVSILHKTSNSMSTSRVHRPYTYFDPNPMLCTYDTPIGFMSIARRRADNQFYWRVTQWMAPMFSLVPSAAWPIGGRAWVPIDDENTYCWDFSYSPDGPLPREYLDVVATGASFPPETSYQPIQLNTGSVIDTWQPTRTYANDYMIDRRRQTGANTTGIFGVNDQDRAMQEGMGRIADRTKEKLVASDAVVVAARRRLFEIIETPESLQKFGQMVMDGTAFAVDPVDAVSAADDVGVFLAEHRLN
jgi:phenylpropionate dioxygenase-like ring-hydroxylating dioxygenase large terminal subunit